MMHKVHNYLRNVVLTIVCLFVYNPVVLFFTIIQNLEYDGFFQLSVWSIL
jgi:hypothetical protein